MTDDPREILKEAGVECAKLDEYVRVKDADAEDFEPWTATNDSAETLILALSRLVAKYKWQRDQAIVMIGDNPSALRDHLNARWNER